MALCPPGPESESGWDWALDWIGLDPFAFGSFGFPALLFHSPSMTKVATARQPASTRECECESEEVATKNTEHTEL